MDVIICPCWKLNHIIKRQPILRPERHPRFYQHIVAMFQQYNAYYKNIAT